MLKVDELVKSRARPTFYERIKVKCRCGTALRTYIANRAI